MKNILVLICMLPLVKISFAQGLCGFDQIHQLNLKNDPAYARQMQDNDEKIRAYILEHPELMTPGRMGETIYTIPVVVHVIHTGGAIGSIYNPTDQQIIAAIEDMNNIYSGAYPWVGGTEGAKDIGIRFVLAKRDPNCNPTNGIVRVNASELTGYVRNGINGSGVSEITVKNLSRWDPSSYYNIWVVNKINGSDGTSGQFIAGYAYFPGSSRLFDGTVVLATTIRNNNNKILTHELGHAFNLYHPFEGSNSSAQCPSNSNCETQGDRVCDTDPISLNSTNNVVDFSCRTESNPCSGKLFSPKTESNFMNYTRCFTLFTEGQKARMRAAMNFNSRASLAASLGSIAPDQFPACPPNINFSSSSAIISESKTNVSGCSGYRDYEFNMSIARSPSSNAVVTLSAGGTATNGVDYKIFTGGDFSTPSSTINFPPGSNTGQTFVIRVNDDADVEDTENIALSFSVSGGEAQVGGSNPVLNISLTDNDSLPNPPNDVVSYDPSISNVILDNQVSPFRADKIKHRVQSIYLASELRAAGFQSGQQITGIGLNITTKNSTHPYAGFTVSLGMTPVTNLSNGFRNVTEMFSGTINTVVGMNQIDFAQPFVWDGNSNLIVQFCFDNSGTGEKSVNDFIDGQSNALGTSVIATCLADFNSQTADACSLPRAFNASSRPVIRFFGLTTGNSVAVNSGSTVAELGPKGNVYFFSESGQILARIKNLTDFNYGCTKVEIDRSGSASFPFWVDNPLNHLTQKSFFVTPQFSNPNGNFQVDLYYTADEKKGYEQQTGQSWSNVLMVKSAVPVASVTPGNQQKDKVVINFSPAFSGYGSEYVVSAGFNGSLLSGYSVGIPSGVASVSDLTTLNKVQVYPNPVSKTVNIKFDQAQRNVSIRIISSEGRILKLERLKGAVQYHALSFDQMHTGIYLLEIQTDEGRKTISLIKQ